MAKIWADVERSPAFQRLSPQDRVNAKKDYWDEVISNDSEYITLPPERQGLAKQRFFGGRLVEDVPEGEFEQGAGIDLPWNLRVTPDAAVQTLKTAGQSAARPAIAAANLAGGVIQEGGAALGPAAGMIPGGRFGKMLEAMPGAETRRQSYEGLTEAVKNPVQTAKAIGQDYAQAYGSVDKLAETVAEDPFRFVMDVAAIGGAAGTATRTAGRLAGNPNLVRAGSFPTLKTGEGLPTFKAGAGKAGEVARAVGTKIRKSPQKLTQEATSIYRDILRPTQGEVKKIEVKLGKKIDDYYRLAAEEGLPIKKTADNKLDTIEAASSLQPKIAQAHDQLNDILRSKKNTFDLNDIRIVAKRNLRRGIKNADELSTALAQVDKYIDAEIARYGPKVNALRLNNIKQGMWSVGYDALQPTSKSTARRIGSVIRKRIERAFPDENIQGLNRLSGDYQTLMQLLENANGRVIKGGRLGGYFARGAGTIIGGLAGQVIPFPGVGAAAGAIAGNAMGAKFASRLYDPARRAAAATSKMRTAAQRTPLKRSAYVPEILGGPELRASQGIAIPYQSRALPAPRDVPYNPSGSRAADVPRQFRMTDPGSGPVIEGGLPPEMARAQRVAEIKKALEEFNKSTYVKKIKSGAKKIRKSNK